MMLALPDDEQLALARGVADFVADAFPIARLRENRPRDGERWGERWGDLAALGVFGVGLAEAEGGLGLTCVEQVLVARELGRTLVSPAAIAAMLAPQVAAEAGEPALCAALLAGERQVGIGLGALDGEARAIDADDGLALMVAGDTVSLIAGPPRPLQCIDETSRLFAMPLPGSGNAATVVATTVSPGLALAAHLLAAAMLVGQLETTRDMAATQARTRVQFGHPIGAYQAIKHRCADAALGAELCWTQVWAAAHALASLADNAEFQVRAAKWLAGTEALKAARFNIQAHGGMGFTQECDAQLLLKRTHILNQMFGNPQGVPGQLVNLPVEA
ncbi:acyl-CoA dehydrogenase family protein [Novosphingobium bradum]|uniref:Acyl-CoA dehydrogenase family protein n=1 Tax=Novosphingobium bradum TaxID=1737444 RepID=A0ABV7IP22_9SPHN